MKLLYGTTNPGKLEYMRRALEPLGLTLLGLKDLNRPVPKVEETGGPLENAGEKARAYYRAFGLPVFSCDSGLYFDGVGKEDQPGPYVRRVGGKELSDEEMIGHYAALARRYGGRLTARYRNAIFLQLDGETCYSSMAEELAGPPFLLVESPHPRRVEGFPLDALSVDIKTGKYFYDIGPEASQTGYYEGFRAFFEKIFGKG